MTKTIAIVTPVLDDWRSFAALLGDISHQFTGAGLAFRVYAVDDGSLAVFDPASVVLPADSCIVSIEVIRLTVNLGHQRAIAVGLCTIADAGDIDGVLVMDSDGEDRPARRSRTACGQSAISDKGGARPQVEKIGSALFSGCVIASISCCSTC